VDQNFAKAFDIDYLSADGKRELAGRPPGARPRGWSAG
jgi:hypothetical protein